MGVPAGDHPSFEPMFWTMRAVLIFGLGFVLEDRKKNK